MSTDPTPEAIEAAAAEICDWDNQYAWKSLGAESPMKASYEDAAKRALTAAAPIIAAQAKSEALREAANEADMWSMAGAYFPEWEKRAEWLRARAATIAPDVTP